MNRTVKKTLKVTTIVVTLLVLVVAAGVGYTWYVGQYGEEEGQAFQQPAQPTGGKQTAKTSKVDENAVMGAAVQSITSPVIPGSNASVMVRTNPQANCVISVIYDKTPSKDSGLIEKKADEYGLVEWTWTVESTVPLGKWPVKVTCANKKHTAVVENDLRVVKTLE
jgi:hypothetical protein